ncbi:MAG TPA: hypothetical protein VGR56_04755 [Nitrososphaerales archaeon]|nr:hypothetical protein [Nitrososphaerales archaeon]
MATRGYAEDISTLLFLVPFLGAGIYGLVLWVQAGISPVLPTSVYLTVTRDPVLFIIGTLSILLGVMIQVNSADPSARQARLASLGNELQSKAIASLILVIISAFYANGFLDLSGAATDFIIGRYALVFPAMLVLLSYLLTARFRWSSLMNRKVLAVIALLLVPASIYVLGKRQPTLGLGGALVLLIVGVALFVIPERKKPAANAE